MPFTISKEFHFSASHQLAGLSSDHPCSRLHGHNYIVIVEITGDVNPIGFVVDYRELEPIKQWIDQTLDHKHLNDVFTMNPTAELMAKYMYHKFENIMNMRMPACAKIKSVIVKETEKTAAKYEPQTDY